MKESPESLFGGHIHAVACLKPGDISPRRAANVLKRLNSFDSAQQLRSTLGILGRKDAQRIVDFKIELGKFEDLEQVMIVRGIGPKKFDFIVRGLSD